jgi:hypothetical protein
VPQWVRNAALQIFENRIVAQSVATIVVFLTFVTVLSPLVSFRGNNRSSRLSILAPFSRTRDDSAAVSGPRMTERPQGCLSFFFFLLPKRRDQQ